MLGFSRWIPSECGRKQDGPSDFEVIHFDGLFVIVEEAQWISGNNLRVILISLLQTFTAKITSQDRMIVAKGEGDMCVLVTLHAIIPN